MKRWNLLTFTTPKRLLIITIVMYALLFISFFMEKMILKAKFTKVSAVVAMEESKLLLTAFYGSLFFIVPMIWFFTFFTQGVSDYKTGKLIFELTNKNNRNEYWFQSLITILFYNLILTTLIGIFYLFSVVFENFLLVFIKTFTIGLMWSNIAYFLGLTLRRVIWLIVFYVYMYIDLQSLPISKIVFPDYSHLLQYTPYRLLCFPVSVNIDYYKAAGGIILFLVIYGLLYYKFKKLEL